MPHEFYQTDQNEPRNLYRAFLVGACVYPTPLAEVQDDLLELAELVSTLDVPVAGKLIATLRIQNPKLFVGLGKAEEIMQAAQECEANVIIFDVQLSPTQQRNLEHMFKIKVIDRQEVILDIFANRAKTKEAVLQVELARYQYFLPRLTGAWTHLSRQRGGVTGARGGGEKQIEYDRRQLRQRISDLQAELDEVKQRRNVQRKSRERADIPNAALAGYTNAGKTTLLNYLTGADAFAANQLFATLDPTSRRLELPDRTTIVLTDTVGFVRRLPHALVNAFLSTLEEAVLSDFILLVLDASSPYVYSHLETTMSVLAELGAEKKSILIVCNKSDLIEDPMTRAKLQASFPDAVFVSCITGEGIDELKNKIAAFCGKRSTIQHLLIPASRSDLVSKLYEHTNILDSSYTENGDFEATAVVPEKLNSVYQSYIVNYTNKITQSNI